MSSSTTSKRTSTSDGQGRQRLLLALGGLVVLAAIVGIAVLSTGERGSRVTVDDIAGEPSIEGQPLPTAGQDPQNDPALGSQAPVVAGADFDGTPVTIGEPGTPQLLMFMASWCPACQQELREVSPWLNEGGLRDDVELIAVATLHRDNAQPWPPDEWFASEDFTYPILVDDADGSVADAYGLNATPFWVALDAEGRVIARIAGMQPLAQIEALADAVAGGPA